MTLFLLILVALFNYWVFSLKDEHMLIVLLTVLGAIAIFLIVNICSNIVQEKKKEVLKSQLKNKILAEMLTKELEKKRIGARKNNLGTFAS